MDHVQEKVDVKHCETFAFEYIWTIITGRDIGICHLCGSISSDIICHSVAECRVTFPLKEHFINWVSSEISVDYITN